MDGFARVVRLFSGAALIWVLSGCAVGGRNNYEVLEFHKAVEELARSARPMHAREPQPTTRIKPAIQPKPTDSAEDSDDRHPSRWNRKLKASYA